MTDSKEPGEGHFRNRVNLTKTIRIALTFGPFVLFSGGILTLYYYLITIGWPELLLESVASLSGIGILFSGVMIVTILVIFILFLTPLLFYIFLKVKSSLDNISSNISHILSISLLASAALFSLESIGREAVYEGKSGTIAAIASFTHQNFMACMFLSTVAITLLSVLLNLKTSKLSTSITLVVPEALGCVIFSFLGTVMTAYLLFHFFRPDGMIKNLLPVFAIIPGMVLSRALLADIVLEKKKNDFVRGLVGPRPKNQPKMKSFNELIRSGSQFAIFLGIMMFLLVTLFSGFFSSTIARNTFEQLGVFSADEQLFQLIDTKQKSVFTRMNFRLLEIADDVYISGYVGFRFNEILIICVSPNPFYSQGQQTKTSQRCIRTNNREIRRLQVQPISELTI